MTKFSEIEFRGMNPIPAKNTEKLTPNDNQCYALRYAAMRFISTLNEQLFDRFQTYNQIDDSNSFQDDELYLGDFEGIEINERENLRTFYMNTHERVVADVYDKETDSFTTYLID